MQLKRTLPLIVVLAASSPALADQPSPPDPAEILAQDKIQFGQLLIQLGNAELELVKLKKELADTKSKSEAAPH